MVKQDKIILLIIDTCVCWMYMLVCMLVFVCLLPLNVVVQSPVLCQRSISQSTYTRPHPPIQACRLRTMLVVLAVMSTCQAFALTWCRSVALPRMGAAWRCLVDSIQPFSSADRTRRQQGGSALLVRAASSVPDAMYVPRFVRSAGWKLIALNHYHNPCIHTHTPCTSRSRIDEDNRRRHICPVLPCLQRVESPRPLFGQARGRYCRWTRARPRGHSCPHICTAQGPASCTACRNGAFHKHAHGQFSSSFRQQRNILPTSTAERSANLDR